MSFQFYESRVFSSILHVLAIVQFIYAMHYNFNHLNIPDVAGVPKMLRIQGFGGMAKFLTFWCLVSKQKVIKKVVKAIRD